MNQLGFPFEWLSRKRGCAHNRSATRYVSPEPLTTAISLITVTESTNVVNARPSVGRAGIPGSCSLPTRTHPPSLSMRPNSPPRATHVAGARLYNSVCARRERAKLPEWFNDSSLKPHMQLRQFVIGRTVWPVAQVQLDTGAT